MPGRLFQNITCKRLSDCNGSLQSYGPAIIAGMATERNRQFHSFLFGTIEFSSLRDPCIQFVFFSTAFFPFLVPPLFPLVLSSFPSISISFSPSCVPPCVPPLSLLSFSSPSQSSLKTTSSSSILTFAWKMCPAKS